MDQLGIDFINLNFKLDGFDNLFQNLVVKHLLSLI